MLTRYADDSQLLVGTVTVLFHESRKEVFTRVYDDRGNRIDFQTPEPLVHQYLGVKGKVVHQQLLFRIRNPQDLVRSGIKYQAYSKSGEKPVVSIPGAAIDALLQKAMTD